MVLFLIDWKILTVQALLALYVLGGIAHAYVLNEWHQCHSRWEEGIKKPLLCAVCPAYDMISCYMKVNTDPYKIYMVNSGATSRKNFQELKFSEGR